MPLPEREVLARYLQTAREAMLWKLDGLSPLDQRRPLVPTGTNLLGLVKHLAGVEFGYFGEVFGRPPADAPDWLDSDDPHTDLFATAEETAVQITDLYRRAWAHSDTTVAELGLDAIGEVPWWPPERREVSVRQVLVHVIAETNRHAGHADILREQLDGSAGLRQDNPNLPEEGPDWWAAHLERLEGIARNARA